MNGTVNKFVFVWALALTAFIVMGLTIPNNFTAGTTISSAEMNANFAAVKTAVDALEAVALPTSQGTVLGYVFVNGATGAATNPFMKTGGVPTTNRTGVGAYTVAWPGENVLFNDTPVFVLPSTSNRSASFNSVGAGAMTTVTIRDLANAAADSSFWIMILQDHNP